MVKKRWFPNYHIMVKPTGPICNLKCEYCYYLHKRRFYPDSMFQMKNKVLEKFMKEYLTAQSGEEVTIGWQGGEPLLRGIDFYKKAVEYQEKYKKPDQKVVNAFQTNGTLLTDEWAEFLHENKFLIGISIDGPEQIHNIYRHDKKGNDTFDKVLHGLKLLQKHKVEYNILTTVHKGNVDHPLEVYRYFRDELKAEFMQFIPIVEHARDIKIPKGKIVSDRTVPAKKYGEFLTAIFMEWVRNDVGKVFVQHFDVTLGSWMGVQGGLCVFQPTCGFALVLEHNGDLYSCDHFVYPENKLGNIKRKPLDEMVNSGKQFTFGHNKLKKLPQYCVDCEFRFACHGGCPKNRIIYTHNGELGLNYLCKGYKHFFKTTAPYFKKMGEFLREGKLAMEIMKEFEGK